MKRIDRKSSLRRMSLWTVVLAMLACVAGGCKEDVKPVEPPTVAHYIELESLSRIQRVAFIPLRASGDNEDIGKGMSRALFESIQARRLFQIDMIDPADPALEKLQQPGQPWTLTQMAALRQSLQCDAVLLGVVTDFQPYPRMLIGLRLRLLDLRRGKLVWGVDQMWDTTDWQVLHRIEEYYEHRMSKTVQPLEWRLVTMSPNAFEQFVASEIGQTLPNCGPEPKKDCVIKEKVKEFVCDQ